jgi:hypothetical protein
MRFEVPTHYETNYLLPKKRNDETAVFSTVVSVDIREKETQTVLFSIVLDTK